MHHKKLILLAFISFVILGSLCVLCWIVTSMNLQQGQNVPTSYPLSYPGSFAVNPGNIIQIDGNPSKVFKFGVITSEDTIELRNNLGEKFVIELDHRKWKDIKWSPNGTLVSALGESQDNIFDLFIYNLITQKWSRATNFQNAQSGIDEYIWKDKDDVLFVQGKDNDRWVYNYNYSSQTEILKLNKIDGDIVSISPDKKYLIAKTNGIFSLLDDKGAKISAFDSIVDLKGMKLNIADVELNSTSDKVLYETTDGLMYKGDLGSKDAVKLNNIVEFNTVCNVDEDKFIGYDYFKTGNRIRILNLDVKESKAVPFAESVITGIQSINNSESSCFEDGNVLLSITTDENRWFRVNKGELEEMFALRGANEVSVSGL